MENHFIQELPHEPERPVSMERGPGDVVYIEGVAFAGDFFRSMALPDPNRLYAIRRDGDRVWLTSVSSLQEAQKFFEEAQHAV